MKNCSTTSSHSGHLNSYIGINEPFQSRVTVPVPLFNAFLPIDYFTDSAFSSFHLVIATLVTSGYVIFSISQSLSWIDESLLEAILTLHQPDNFALFYLALIRIDASMGCGFFALSAMKWVDFFNHFWNAHLPSDPIFIHRAGHWADLLRSVQTQPRYSLPSFVPCLRIIGP